MKIEKLPSGSYRVRKMYQGKSYSVTFDFKPTQKEALQAISAELDKIKLKKSILTFEDSAKEYIELKSNILSPSTLREYTGMKNRFSDTFKQLRISEITSLDVQMEINRLAKGKSPKTIRNYHGFISAILDMYRPDLALKTTLPQREKKTVYIPTDQDIKRIMKEIKGSQFEVAILLACYGLRRSEICALTLDDLENNTFHITKAKVQNSKKEWVIKSTKTTESTRDVIISPILAEMIRKQGYVYKGYPNSIVTYLEKIEKRLGIPKFSLHKLRHYFASKMSTLGVPEEDILKMGGWQTDHVMKTVYRHSLQTLESQQKTSDKFSDSLFG